MTRQISFLHYRAAFLAIATLSGLFCEIPAAFGQQNIVYVDVSATEGEVDGSDWPNAFTDLQDALDFARSPEGSDVQEIWVAVGTYKPDRGTGDRGMTFDLIDGIGLYGGFAGTETSRDQRDRAANETILSGDLLGNDLPEFDFSNPCCQAHNGPGCGSTECEAIMAQTFPSPFCSGLLNTLFPCSCFFQNWLQECADHAQIVCCDECMPDRCDNTLTMLRAQSTDGATTAIDGFTIRGANTRHTNQEAPLSIKDGGASVRNCTFENNVGRRGSSIIVDAFESPEHTTITDCVFRENFGISGPIYVFYGLVEVTNCTFSDNLSSRGSGAIGITDPDGTVVCRDCHFVNNLALMGGAIGGGGAADLADCTFIGNARYAIRLGGLAPTYVRRCVFQNQTNGAVYTDDWAPTFIFDSWFINNNGIGASLLGGGIVANSIFAGNLGSGALKVGTDSAETPLILHSLFLGNHINSSSGPILIDQSPTGAWISSCIFLGNTNLSGGGESAQIDVDAAGVEHSIVEGWTGNYPGEGSFDADPLFVDIIGPDGIPYTGDEDYRLCPESQAINTGDPNPPAIPVHDLDGHPRVLCGAPDIGPYEFGIGDFDCDLSVSIVDFSGWQSCMTGPSAVDDSPPLPSGCEAFDFNADDIVDLSDFAGWQNTFSGSTE